MYTSIGTKGKSMVQADRLFPKVVLHCCCAPCSCAVIESILQNGMEPLLFFYNPNVHPQDEYERRKAEIVRYAAKVGVVCIEGAYDTERWHGLVKGREADPERGQRCSICFEMRLAMTAVLATEQGIPVFATTLSISRWKNFEQICLAGERVAASFPGLTYWNCNWRKNNGSQRMQEIVRQEQFYRQSYCGCCYSHKASAQDRHSKAEP